VFKSVGIRTSIFVDAKLEMLEGASEVGTDRVELYTESYATGYVKDRDVAIAPFAEAGIRAKELNLGLNAGHDLNRHNLKFFNEKVPGLLEVSIGHAFVADALYYGFENTVGLYLRELR
jgi:pyridoxine 5-phosphate synthase